MALELIIRAGITPDDYRSKSWNEFALPDAPEMDFVFTVCDNAAHETCPVWPGHPVTAHWGVPDPAAVSGSLEDQRKAFLSTCLRLQARISLFLSLPMDTLDRLNLQQKLGEIGRL